MILNIDSIQNHRDLGRLRKKNALTLFAISLLPQFAAMRVMKSVPKTLRWREGSTTFSPATPPMTAYGLGKDEL